MQSTPWNNQGAQDPVAAPSPNVPGRQGVKFVVPGGGKRSEVQPAGSTYKDGDHKFFGYSGYLDKDFATDAQDWQVIWQLHDDGANGSPPVALEVGKGHLWLATSGNDHDKDLGPVTPGSDVAVQLEVQFQTGGGLVNVWRDGKPLVSNYKPAKGTTVDGADYLKAGIYRDPSEGKASTLYLNDLKIGDSLASVGNLAGAPPAAAGGVAGAALPALGVLLAAVPLAAAGLRRRRRRSAPPALPRPRPAFEPPSRSSEARELERAGR
jgi:hypothetical protein